MSVQAEIEAYFIKTVLYRPVIRPDLMHEALDYMQKY